MADTVTTQVLVSGSRKYVVKLTCISDGSGETNVVKVDKSTLVLANGQEPSKFSIEEIQWSITGFSYVKLSGDRTSDTTLAIIGPGNGYLNFRAVSGVVDTGSGGTGDILLSSGSAAAGATYDITLVLKLKD